ncbi:MAB_1171c family putative transporter [Actinoplanes sp. NBRC 101535]|uniref:MAB_1171c family putative transporter n=1 Tax=Actinoplanes sp. NBRC 101535 TaxID=3032196 RepID=UPI0024A2DB4F|nr:MAB_1171c family putative transporter [Actinoplanes sp. NBRC 101535]GLY00610.1 hypothetical protein Acsp01_09890 [Actinoplanes sp. NBRC 101535]
MTAAVVLGLLWAVVLIRLPTLRRGHRRRVLWGSLFAAALAGGIAAPAVAAGRDVPFAAHLCGVAAAHLLLRLIDLVTGARRDHARWAFTTAVILVMSVLALSVPGGVRTSPHRQTAGITPAEVVYWTVFEGYLVVILVLGARACARIARSAPAGVPRTGMRAMAVGIALIAGYAAGRILLVAARGAGVPVDFAAVGPPVGALRTAGVALVLVGSAAPPALRMRELVRAHRVLWALRPLWTAIRGAFPEVVLLPAAPRARDQITIAEVRLRQYRRVIEIRDGMLALREHLPPAGSGTVPDAGTDPAVVEARGIALALRRRAAGEPPLAVPGCWAPVGPDMADEIAWLSRVSAAFRSPGAVSGAGVRTPRPGGSPH